MAKIKKHSRNIKGEKQKVDKMLAKIIHDKHKKHPINYAFNIFAKKASDIVGSAWAFTIALLTVIIWGFFGHYFNYSDTWQLIINTSTTIITFLVVFLIQNTQNRDTEILNLKIDELVFAQKKARNRVINLDVLSDAELKQLEKEYIKLYDKRSAS